MRCCFGASAGLVLFVLPLASFIRDCLCQQNTSGRRRLTNLPVAVRLCADLDPDAWSVTKVFFADQMFDSIQALLLSYNSSNANEGLRTYKPHLPSESPATCMHCRLFETDKRCLTA